MGTWYIPVCQLVPRGTQVTSEHVPRGADTSTVLPVHLCLMTWQCGTGVMLLHELVLPNHVYRYVPDSVTLALYRSTVVAPSSKLPMLRTFSIEWWFIPGFDAQSAVRSERLTRRFDRYQQGFGIANLEATTTATGVSWYDTPTAPTSLSDTLRNKLQREEQPPRSFYSTCTSTSTKHSFSYISHIRRASEYQVCVVKMQRRRCMCANCSTNRKRGRGSLINQRQI